MALLLINLWISTIITLCTSNCSKCRSRETSLSGESNRVSQLNFRLRQSTVTKVECFESFPVCFAEVLAALFSDTVVF